MNPVVIRNVRIGEGIPKICVPIVGKTKEEILEAVNAIHGTPADIVEWRADWFDAVFSAEAVEDVLQSLREALGEIPLLFTFRTAGEGGEKEIEADVYAALNKAVAATGNVDLIDVEAFTGDEIVREMIDSVHACGVKIVASNHEFTRTPDKEEIIRRFRKMQEMNADILKIAVMPVSPRDVLTLLSATEEMVSEYAERPVVSMSMSGTGVISRLCGEVFGSAMTFGAAGQASAPGQIGVDDLNGILQLLHRSV